MAKSHRTARDRRVPAAARSTSGSCALCRRRSSAASIRSARGCRPRARCAGASRVSRHTVREALRHLRESGLVSPRQGSGTTVAAAEPSFYVHPVASVDGSDAIRGCDALRGRRRAFVIADTRLARRLGCSSRHADGCIPKACATRPDGRRRFAGPRSMSMPPMPASRSLIGKRTGPIYTWIEEMYDERVVEVDADAARRDGAGGDRGQAQASSPVRRRSRSSASTSPPSTAHRGGVQSASGGTVQLFHLAAARARLIGAH